MDGTTRSQLQRLHVAWMLAPQARVLVLVVLVGLLT